MNVRDISTFFLDVAKMRFKLPPRTIDLVVGQLRGLTENKVDKITMTKLFQGLRCIDPKSVDSMKSLLVCLMKILDRFTIDGGHLGAFGAAQCLYALQRLKCDHYEVQSLLQLLAVQTKGCDEAFTAQAVGNALYGLQNMSSADAEVREVLVALTEKIRGCKEALDAQAVGNALYGLIPLCCSPGVNDSSLIILKTLTIDLDKLLVSSGALLADFDDQKDLMRLLLLFQHFAGQRSPQYDLSSRIGKLRTHMRCDGSNVGKHGTTTKSRNRSEESFFQCIKVLLIDNPAYEVMSNVFLLDCFESDIVIKRSFTSADGESNVVLYNIEIDGPSHLFPTKQRFCRYRDKLLKEAHGVQIARIDTAGGGARGKKEVKARAREVLSEWKLLPPPGQC